MEFTQYVLFCVRLLLLTMFYANKLVSHDVACINNSFPSVTEQYFIV